MNTSKDFKPNDIVYFLRDHGYKRDISYGIVNDIYSDGIVVDLLEPRDLRLVQGIPIKEWKIDPHKYKLPKGWTYHTILFSYEYSEPRSEFQAKIDSIDIKDPNAISQAISDNLLVRSIENDRGYIDTDIEKDGYYLRKKYDNNLPRICSLTIPPHLLYHTYSEAEAKKKEYDDELTRQANLTDEEWSIEQIDKTIDTFAYLYGISDKTKQAYRKRLLELDNIADVETRIYGGAIQYKYWKKQRWNTIECSSSEIFTIKSFDEAVEETEKIFEKFNIKMSIPAHLKSTEQLLLWRLETITKHAEKIERSITQ